MNDQLSLCNLRLNMNESDVVNEKATPPVETGKLNNQNKARSGDLRHNETFKSEGHNSRAWEDRPRLAQPLTMKDVDEKARSQERKYEPEQFVL